MRSIAIALLFVGLAGSSVLLLSRSVPTALAASLFALFSIAIALAAFGHRAGRWLGGIAVSGLSVLLMITAVAAADPEGHAGEYPGSVFYLWVALTALYWVASIAALRAFLPIPSPQAENHA
jgi:hypothetical protein